MPKGNELWEEQTVLQLIGPRPEMDPIRHMEAYAEKLLDEAHQRLLPVDVYGIASLLGIRIRIGPQPFAGRVYVDGSGSLLMDLNATDIEARRRFTCAHEIMHTAFPGFHRDTRYRVDRSVGAQMRSRGEEEYLCDRGAAALLMPVRNVEGLYDAGRGLGDVERLAQASQVSLEAAAIRLTTIASRPTVFVVLDWAHSPSDRPGLRRGEVRERTLRVRYGCASGLDLRIPRAAAAPEGSVFFVALSRRGRIRGVSKLPGLPSGPSFFVEAKAYGPLAPGDGRRILAIARRVDSGKQSI